MQYASPARRSVNIWPGFVDALAALLMVIIFLLLLFTIGQFYLTNVLTDKEESLVILDRQVARLADLLTLEKATSASLQEEVGELTAQLAAKNKSYEILQADVRALMELREKLELEVASLAHKLQESDTSLAAEQEISATALARSASLQEEVGELTAQLAAKNKSYEILQADVRALMELREKLELEVASLAHKLQESDTSLAAEQEISATALAKIELLNRQVKALREQLGAVSAALGLDLDAEDESIENIAARLNVALAEKAQELARYRSDFFGRLREVLGDNPDIQVVGDRFILQSELLFDSGSATLGEKGKQQVRKLSKILSAVAKDIPPDIEWIVRIDGHTDRRPINTATFPSNWELSTARALAIVRFMIAQGVPAKRLAATGFGQHYPFDPRKTAEAYAKNRRIEVKLTAR